MPAASERYRPCSARSRRPSVLRVKFAVRVLSSMATAIDGSMTWLSEALPASTLSVPPTKETFVPSFHCTGCFPTLDIVRLCSPDGRESLAAHAAGATLAVREHACGRAVDGDAGAVEHAADLRDAGVEPAPGLAVPTDAADEQLAVRTVLEAQREQALHG